MPGVTSYILDGSAGSFLDNMTTAMQAEDKLKPNLQE